MHLVIKDKSVWDEFRKDEKKRRLPHLSVFQSLFEADLMWQSAYEISINNGIDWVSLHSDISNDRKPKGQLNFTQIMAQSRNYLKR